MRVTSVSNLNCDDDDVLPRPASAPATDDPAAEFLGRELIITNGDAAAGGLKMAGQGYKILPWRDVLHDGPVPDLPDLPSLSQVRAVFLAGNGWASFDKVMPELQQRDEMLIHNDEYDRVTLWFEHDLYDQLQLIQILDFFHSHPRADQELYLVQADEYLGELPPTELGRLADRSARVTPAQTGLATRAWQAFRHATPEALAVMLEEDLTALPWLGAAIERLLAELPTPGQGLSRTELNILRAIELGHNTPQKIFGYVQSRETARFMGDLSFCDVLDNLTHNTVPLIEGIKGCPYCQNRQADEREVFLNCELSLSLSGREVLDGHLDHAGINRIRKWFGGCLITNDNLWRWDPAKKIMLPPPAR